MRFLLRAFALLLLVAASGCAGRSHARRHAGPRAGESPRGVALAWVQLLDARSYSEAFAQESPRAQERKSAEIFLSSMHARRDRLGRMKTRAILRDSAGRGLSGAADGRHRTILFQTSFEHKPVAAERVILIKEHGQWRVTDYRIY